MPENRMAVAIEKLRAASESASKGLAYTAGRPWFTNIDGVLIGSPDPHAGTLIAELDTTHLDPDEAYEIDDAANADFIVEAWNFARMVLGRPDLLDALRDAGTGRDSGEAKGVAAASDGKVTVLPSVLWRALDAEAATWAEETDIASWGAKLSSDPRTREKLDAIMRLCFEEGFYRGAIAAIDGRSLVDSIDAAERSALADPSGGGKP